MSSNAGVNSALKLVDMKSALEDEVNTSAYQHLRTSLLASLTDVVNKQLGEFLTEVKADLVESVKTSCDDLRTTYRSHECFEDRLKHIEDLKLNEKITEVETENYGNE